MTIQASNVGPLQSSKSTYDFETGTSIYVEYRGPLTKVEVVLPEGIRAQGWSRLNDEEDIYNKEFGEILATTRATARALRKYEKYLARYGNAY